MGKNSITDALQTELDCAPLFDFCRNHERIFLYGAGDCAGKCSLLLNSKGIEVAAYIVSDLQHDKEYLNRPVCGIDEIKDHMRVGDGIIPAFNGATARDVQEMLGVRAEDVFLPNMKAVHQMLMPVISDRIRDNCSIEPLEQCKFLPRKSITTILVIRIDFIGDMICSTAFLRELQNNYPDASISLVCNRINEPLLRACPYIDKLYFYNQSGRSRNLAQQCMNVEELKASVERFLQNEIKGRSFDVVFLARELLYGATGLEEIMLALSVKARYRVAYVIRDNSGIDPELKREVFGPFFSMLVLLRDNCATSNQPLHMLRGCGLTVCNRKTELWISEEARKEAEKKRHSFHFGERMRIAIGLKGSATVRCWDKENFQKLFELLLDAYQDDLSIVIFGGTDAQEDALELESMERVTSFAGKLALDETAAMMSLCDLYIGPSTSLLHMATALRIPSVTLYHILDEPSEAFDLDGPPKWAPDDDLPHSSLLPPPGLDGCRGFCRKAYAHCINLITPEQVCDAVTKLLNQTTK